MRTLALVSGYLLVAVTHVLVGLALYADRVMNKNDLPDSVVFFLPWTVAALAYGTLFWRSGFTSSKTRSRLAITLAVALIAAVVSFGFMFTIAANQYGT